MDSFLGQLMPVASSYAYQNTAFTNGQLLPVNQYQALYSLLGTTYGGNGQTNFALPNTQGRTIIGFGINTSAWGATGGEASHALSVNEMPQHTHLMRAAIGGTTDPSPASRQPGVPVDGAPAYGDATGLVTLGATPLLNNGGQPHSNMQPSLALNFVIVLQGIYPTRN